MSCIGYRTVSITYLAEQMIKLSGSKPGKDIKIVYTGLSLVKS